MIRFPASRRLAGALLFSLSLLLGEVGFEKGWTERVDTFWTDVFHRWAGQRYVPEHVGLVVVDDATLALYPDDPLVFWTPYFAQAVKVLREAGASVVGLDFLFASAPERWLEKLGISGQASLRNFDRPLRQEIASGKLILVAASLPGTDPGGDLLLPHSEYLLAIPGFDLERHVGLGNVFEDPDGGVRQFAVSPVLADGQADTARPRWSLPALLALHAGLAVGGGEMRRITYSGPPGSFPRLPMSDLLRPDALQLPQVKALHGKVVIIGGDYQGMNDVHVTPYATTATGSPSGRWMAGVEIQANAAETLLSGRETLPVGILQRLLLQAIVLGLALFVWLRYPLWFGGVALLGLATVVVAFGYREFLACQLLPVGAAHAGLVAAFAGSLAFRMTAGERQREHLRRVFGRYVSDAVVERLVSGRKMPDLGGEEAVVSVLFSDIRSFTRISELLTPRETVSILNAYFERVCRVVLEEGGSIDKFVGDAVMVEFGAPEHMPDHALRALRAACRIRDEAADFARWLDERYGQRGLPEFGIGVGIHTGVVIVGSVGSQRRSDFTVIGDNVNIASRLESETRQVGCVILASEATVTSAGEGVQVGRTMSLQVKGRSEPVLACEILGVEKGAI